MAHRHVRGSEESETEKKEVKIGGVTGQTSHCEGVSCCDQGFQISICECFIFRCLCRLHETFLFVNCNQNSDI